MKKIFLGIVLFFLLSIIFVPLFSQASQCAGQTGIVKCGQDASCPCELGDFMNMANEIYSFIVYQIATPLAVIAIIIGGILMMTSAGNPNLMGMGKKVLWSAIIGLALAFATKGIINFILSVVGYNGNRV